MVRGEVNDKVIWKEATKRLFLVKSLYVALEVGRAVLFLMNIIQNPWVSSKVSFFSREASWGKVLTLDIFQNRGQSLVNIRSMYKLEGGYIDHMLLHCSKARVLWHLLFSLFNVDWMISSSMKDTLLSRHDSFVGRKRKMVQKAAPFCIFWTIQWECNQRVFEDKEQNDQKLKTFVPM